MIPFVGGSSRGASFSALSLAALLLALAACAPPAAPPELAVAGRSPEPVCPSGSGWDGRQCVRTLVVTQVVCPSGSTWDGAACAAQAMPACPDGARFVAGTGCVADVVFEAPVAAGTTPPASSTAPSVSRVVDPFQKPSRPKTRCGCAPTDLMCAMKCNAVCRTLSGEGCPDLGAQTSRAAPGAGRDFDRAAAASALSEAAQTARGCSGVSGTGSVRVVFGPSGNVSSATVSNAPFAGTAQGGCIAAVFRSIRIPAFDGSPVAATKSVAIP